MSAVLLSYLLGYFAESAMHLQLDNMLMLAVGTLVYIFLDAFLYYRMECTKGRAMYAVGRDLRWDVVRKMEDLRYSEKLNREDSQFLSYISNDIPVIEQEYLGALGSICFQIASFCIAVAAALSIQPAMTAVMLLISGIPILFPKLTEKRLQLSKATEQDAKASYLGNVNQLVKNFSQIKVQDAFQEVNQGHQQENQNLFEKMVRFRKMRSLVYAGSFASGNLVFLGTWVVGLFFVAQSALTLPGLIIFTQLMTFVAGPIQIIGEQYATFTAASAVCKKVLTFLDEVPEEKAQWGSQPLEAVETLSLDKVCVTAQGRTLLSQVNLHLRKGDRVALLGESGSGKSTLIQYLAALTEGQGDYIINGRDVFGYAYGDFRRELTLLQQKNYIFNATIRDNLTMFGHCPAEDSVLVDILEKVGLGKWYAQRGASLDAPIGTDAQPMSGGEERRLCLCRTILSGAHVLLLDEPTTGLDAESRMSIEKTIENIDCSILVAAIHEYSPEFLKTFNRIIVMDQGKLSEAPDGSSE